MWVLAVGTMMSVLAMRMFPAGETSASATGVAGTSGPVGSDRDLPVLYSAPVFSLTDQSGQTITSDQLHGHPWVADFIFTTCTSLCPLMSSHMETLQGQLPADIKLVSFSVDPVHDTPPVLLAYAAQYHAQPGRWIFLTGDLKTQTAVVNGMKLFFKPATDGQPIQHDQHFVLVDGQGRVRGYYDSYAPEDLQNLLRDAQYLTDHGDGGSQP